MQKLLQKLLKGHFKENCGKLIILRYHRFKSNGLVRQVLRERQQKSLYGTEFHNSILKLDGIRS